MVVDISRGETLSTTLRVRGCLLGGAVGDALGAPVEFMDIEAIKARFGPAGIRDFVPAYGRIGAVTDDTQMTLFTAEGMLRASVQLAAKGICHAPSVVHHAYMRWLKTQGGVAPGFDSTIVLDGWLIGTQALWSRRAPGNTCLSALHNSKALGKPAMNNSKGCGGLMRAAPAGIVANRQNAFELGTEIAALTHGHPSGHLSAGFLSLLIEEIVAGASLRDSIRTANRSLIAQPGHEEVLKAVDKAEALVTPVTGEAVPAALGQGWVAEEALAIALHCALVAPNFEEAVVLAVNHSGDSDSTGAITGNICGALYGTGSIPPRWLDVLEVRDEITTIADDLTALREGTFDAYSLLTSERYPPW